MPSRGPAAEALEPASSAPPAERLHRPSASHQLKNWQPVVLPHRAQQAAEALARRLDGLAPEEERGWHGQVTDDGGFTVTRELRGVTEQHVIDATLVRSGEARALDAMAAALQGTYARHSTFSRKGEERRVTGPLDLLEAVMTAAQKGLSVQRYKGLGEMNPDQLWETTLDPDARTLLQVKVDDVAEADDIFTKLMGDVVEPRREFIQKNALSVENLDF